MIQRYPHRIRLRGPWEFQPPGGPSVRVTMPTSWGDFAGSAIYRRSFGYPGRIDSFERVWLVLTRVLDRAKITLNNAFVGEVIAQGEFEITRLLRSRNELIVQVEGPSHGGLVGEVALEVRALAFLRDVTVSREGNSLTVAGQLVGETDEQLELYLLVDRRTVEYCLVCNNQPFRLVVQLEESAETILLELVRGAVPWYTWEMELKQLAEPT